MRLASKRKAAPLVGVVLAGGRSARMGADKAFLEYAGEPQILRARRVLATVCDRVLLAVRREQVGQVEETLKIVAAGRSYEEEIVVDEMEEAGPVAGLLAAWQCVPASPLLVLAVDVPLVDAPLLRELLEARDPGALATAFEHADGALEPLCTVWEPAAEPILRARARKASVSLRSVLESSTIRAVKPRDPSRILSVNTPDDEARLRRARKL
jgi:molybdopterin-guanine dinucleotide biosynthesis protein A